MGGSAVSGTWTGAASDSSGTMMGAGMSASMMANMTWQITQTGNTFTGVVQFPGYGGSGTVSGTINGRTATNPARLMIALRMQEELNMTQDES